MYFLIIQRDIFILLKLVAMGKKMNRKRNVNKKSSSDGVSTKSSEKTVIDSVSSVTSVFGEILEKQKQTISSVIDGESTKLSGVKHETK